MSKVKTDCEHYNQTGQCTGCILNGRFCRAKNTITIECVHIKENTEKEINE